MNEINKEEEAKEVTCDCETLAKLFQSLKETSSELQGKIEMLDRIF